MPKSKPFATVAVITRTKDRPLLLRRAIESVLHQSYEDWAMVIVNDGGDPKPVDALVSEYQKQAAGRVHVVHNKTSLGMEGASNKGINSLDSTYLTIHDDDDAWHPDFLKETVAVLEDKTALPQTAGVYTDIERIRESIKGNKVTELARETCPEWEKEPTLWNMCHGNFFPPISFLYTREAFKKVGGQYRAELPVLGDWEFNMRFMQHYELVHLPKILAYYHLREKRGNDEYANTVVDGLDKHKRYNRFLRNEALRRDIEQKQLGEGFLVNFLPEFYEQQSQILKRFDKITRDFENIRVRIDRVEKVAKNSVEHGKSSRRQLNNLSDRVSKTIKMLGSMQKTMYQIQENSRLTSMPMRGLRKLLSPFRKKK